jgi:hypothetical protein
MDFTAYLETALVIVGAAAVIVKGLETVAGITPTTKDDKYVGLLAKYLGYVSYYLDIISGGLKKDSARN